MRIRTFLIALALAAIALPATAQTTTPRTAQIERPTLISPLAIGSVPVLFQWTGVAPGNLYNIQIHGHARQAVVPFPVMGAATYELQISDRPDVASNVLVDVLVDQPNFLFTNQYPDSGFTSRQRNPLSGGLYYYRVRAIFGLLSSQFSTIGRFTLINPPGGTSTPLHDLAVFALGTAGTLISGSAGQLYAVVANTGTFPENGGSVTLVANGATLGSANLPPLAPGQRTTIVMPWTPQYAGQAQIQARLNFADQNPLNNALDTTTTVAEPNAVRTALLGTVRRNGTGTYELYDARNRRVATLTASPQVNLGPFTDRAVYLTGALVPLGNGFSFLVGSVTPQ